MTTEAKLFVAKNKTENSLSWYQVMIGITATKSQEFLRYLELCTKNNIKSKTLISVTDTKTEILRSIGTSQFCSYDVFYVMFN
jgi:hypothetical protein